MLATLYGIALVQFFVLLPAVTTKLTLNLAYLTQAAQGGRAWNSRDCSGLDSLTRQ